MKNMEALSMEELEMVNGGSNIDMGNMGAAVKARLDEPMEKQSFVWLKPGPPHKQ